MRDFSAETDESITQVLTSIQPVAITSRSSKLEPPIKTIVVFPDSSLGPSILIYVQDGGITIPTDHLGETIRRAVVEKIAPSAPAAVAAIQERQRERRANINRTRRRTNAAPAPAAAAAAPVPQVPNAEALALRKQRLNELRRAVTLRKQRNQQPAAV